MVADHTNGARLTTALTTVELVGVSLIVVKRRVPIDQWQVTAMASRAMVEARDLTEREGRWLASARHKGVVRLRRVGGGEARLETEFVAGTNLRTAPLTWAQAASALGLVATTLAELHERGLVHANLAPEHIIVRPGGRHPLLCSPTPTAATPDPLVDLAHLASIADSFGTRARRPASWSEVVEGLESCDDMTAASDLLSTLGARRRARLSRRLHQRAVLQGQELGRPPPGGEQPTATTPTRRVPSSPEG